ncbi:hypothetical protein PCANB_001723 [Pneumocystis canis]|nr:hypothetical protein PCK1_002060 [Pneumocystis canis]KAG5440154.1 hypothetical protein PCANB_001723 [Pneumocystis canis]
MDLLEELISEYELNEKNEIENKVKKILSYNILNLKNILQNTLINQLQNIQNQISILKNQELFHNQILNLYEQTKKNISSIDDIKTQLNINEAIQDINIVETQLSQIEKMIFMIKSLDEQMK